ncbi:hypothetical protein F511_31063 [Dorcoceras hygrometricum]|uniref:Uncharacterized protein n=1 Tax=Dorcoceras hygrometricum TaxID=472368 RepID=A0A2Z7D8S5_9LAMI|nr:hypothetical protein F511_31063 [Dorcoceras hygrometricum]
MQMLCMRHRITTEGSTNKGAKELKHSSKNLQQQWQRAGRCECGIAARPRILISKAAQKLTANYRSSGLGATLNQLNYYQTTYWKLKPMLGIRSHHKGTKFYLHYKTHNRAATSRSSTSQPQPPKVVWNDRASQEESNAISHVPNNDRKRWELPEKATVNSNLGFVAKNTIGETILSYHGYSAGRGVDPTGGAPGGG